MVFNIFQYLFCAKNVLIIKATKLSSKGKITVNIIFMYFCTCMHLPIQMYLNVCTVEDDVDPDLEGQVHDIRLITSGFVDGPPAIHHFFFNLHLLL